MRVAQTDGTWLWLSQAAAAGLLLPELMPPTKPNTRPPQ